MKKRPAEGRSYMNSCIAIIAIQSRGCCCPSVVVVVVVVVVVALVVRAGMNSICHPYRRDSMWQP